MGGGGGIIVKNNTEASKEHDRNVIQPQNLATDKLRRRIRERHLHTTSNCKMLFKLIGSIKSESVLTIIWVSLKQTLFQRITEQSASFINHFENTTLNLLNKQPLCTFVSFGNGSRIHRLSSIKAGDPPVTSFPPTPPSSVRVLAEKIKRH